MAPGVLPMLLLAALGCTPAARPGAPTIRPARPTAEARITIGVDHPVRRGQTLWRIARVYGMDVEELARINGIADPTRLEVGQTVFVPGALFVRPVPPYPAPPGAPGPAPPVSDPSRNEPRQDRDSWLWPVAGGRVLSGFGAPRRGHRHEGVDLRGRAGEPVRAARAGRVAYSGAGLRGYGKTVILDHGGGLSSLYAHNAKLLVHEGQRVRRGQIIAEVGSTGNATAEHCHFEIRRDDRPVDPLRFLLGPTLEARR